MATDPSDSIPSSPEQPLKLKRLGLNAGVLAVLMVLVSLLAGFFLVRAADTRTQERLIAQQTLEADLWARMLTARMEAHQRLLASIAEGLHSSLLDKPAVLDALMQQDGSMLRLFESLHVALPSGVITHHGAIGAVAEIDATGTASLRRALVDGKPSVTFLNVVDDIQHLSVLLCTPMRNGDGQVVGALAAKVKLPIAALMPEVGDSQRDVQYVLLDSDETVLAQSSEVSSLPSRPDGRALLAQHHEQWQALSKPSAVNADTRVWGSTLVTRVGLPLPQWQAVILRDMSQDGLWSHGLPSSTWLAWLGLALGLLLLALWALAIRTRPVENKMQGLRGPVTTSEDMPQEADAAWPQTTAAWERVPAAMWVEQAGFIRSMTPQACVLLGYFNEDAASLTLDFLCNEPQTLVAARQALVNWGCFEGQLMLRKKDGDRLCAQAAAWSCAGVANATVWRLQLPWVLAQPMPLPDKEHAWRDSLTELPNRDAFMWGLQSWVSDSVQADKTASLDARPCNLMPTHGCVLFADLDHLGMMNEVTSREMGNKLLRHIGRLMADYTQPLGQMARLGGDEFAVLLPGVSLAHAQGIGQALCDAVWNWQPHWGGERHWVSVSIGVVAVDAQRHTPEQALHAADMACYEAKRRGRCQVAVGQISTQLVLQG